MPIAYCTECDWERRADDGATDDLDRAMIDHYVETGHGPIERADLEDDLADRSKRPSGTARVERDGDRGRDCEYEFE